MRKRSSSKILIPALTLLAPLAVLSGCGGGSGGGVSNPTPTPTTTATATPTVTATTTGTPISTGTPTATATATGTPTATATTTPDPNTQNYSTFLDFGNGQSGTLNLKVSGGSISGGLDVKADGGTVETAPKPPQNHPGHDGPHPFTAPITVKNYPITGFVSADNSFSIEGNFGDPHGSFAIIGTLPTPTVRGNYTLACKGQGAAGLILYPTALRKR